MRKVFDVLVKKNKIFNIIVTGISDAQTLRFFIRNNIRIVANFKERIKGVVNIKTGKIRLSVLQSKLSTKLTPTIRTGKVKILATFKELLQGSSNISFGVGLSANASERLKGYSNIKLNIKINAYPIVGTFKKLFNHDNSTLLDMDNTTMDNLDYTII